MRNLYFKNLTSNDGRRKVLVSSEIVDKQGVRSIIRRHFVCAVREIKDNKMQKHQPYLYVLTERNTKEHRERFFCKLKGSVYAVSQGRIFLILFIHSLQINLIGISQHLVKYNEEEIT